MIFLIQQKKKSGIVRNKKNIIFPFVFLISLATRGSSLYRFSGDVVYSSGYSCGHLSFRSTLMCCCRLEFLTPSVGHRKAKIQRKILVKYRFRNF